MYVPNYKMHNVLSDYSRKLRSIGKPAKRPDYRQSAVQEKVTISKDARRQAIIERVADRIVQRITRYGPQDDIDSQIVARLANEMEGKKSDADRNQKEFVYNVIDGENRKSTSTLPVQNPEFVIRRLTELARETVDKNMIHPPR